MLKPGITLYFVRHGETDWNAIRRYQGQTDTPLNDHGRRQAARNGRELARLLGAGQGQLQSAYGVAFVASPLSRTAETMRIIRREMGLPEAGFPTDDRLKEIHFGHWEGRIWEKLPEEDPVGFAARRADPFDWRPEGGESYRDLSERVGAWLAGLDRDTLCVSHGGVSRVVRGHVLGLSERETPLLEVPQDRVLVLRDGRMEWV